METRDLRALVLSSLAQGLRLLQGLIIVGVLVMLGSGIRTVTPNEVALVLRLGRLTGATQAQRVHGPGLLFVFPYPIDEIVRVPIRQVKEIIIDELWYPTGGGIGFPATPLDEEDLGFDEVEQTTGLPLALMGVSIDPVREGYCLTGDNYIIQPLAVVKYQICHPVEYALNVSSPEELLRTVLVEQLTRAMGESSVDDVLTRGKRALSLRVTQRSQARLDSLRSGLKILAVEFKEIIPPRHVLQDFQRVVSAAIQSQTMIREAQAYRARELPKARGQARSLILTARADSLRRTAEASVRMTSFLSYLPEYRQSPDALKARLLKETLEQGLARIQHLYLLPGQGRDPGPALRLLLPGKRQ